MVKHCIKVFTRGSDNTRRRAVQNVSSHVIRKMEAFTAGFFPDSPHCRESAAFALPAAMDTTNCPTRNHGSFQERFLVRNEVFATTSLTEYRVCIYLKQKKHPSLMIPNNLPVEVRVFPNLKGQLSDDRLRALLSMVCL